MARKCCKEAHAAGFAAGEKAGRAAGLAAAHGFLIEVAEGLSAQMKTVTSSKIVHVLMHLASTIREAATKESR